MKKTMLTLMILLLPLSANSYAESVAMLSLVPPDGAKISAPFEKTNENKLVLNRHDFWVNYFQKEAGGKLTFLPFFGGKTKKQSLLIQKDYVHYQEVNGERVGILIRLEANVEVSDSEINIEKFQDIGAAAQLGIARGDIKVRVFGLDGPAIYKLQLETDMNSVSLATIENQINDLHAKIMTDETLTITPVVLPNSTFDFRDQNRKQDV